MKSLSKLAYALAFQLGWFVSVLGGNTLGFAYVFIFASYYFWQTFKTDKRHIKPELKWFVIITVCGFIIESLFLSAGFLYVNTPTGLFERLIFPPVWLVCLWSLFAIALRTCMSFVFKHALVTCLLSALVIPLNYYAGAQLSPQIELHRPFALSLGLIALTWIVFLSGLIHIKHHYFEGMLHDH